MSSQFQQAAILDAAPVHVLNRLGFMPLKKLREACVDALIEQNFHLMGIHD